MADLKNTKHIFFDFDDTLWDFKKNSGVILEKLFFEFRLAEKLRTDFEVFEKQYHEINLDLWDKYNKRLIDKHHMRSQRFHKVFKAFGYDNFEENLIITEKYIQETPQGKHLKEACNETLSYLSERYQLHIITNGFSEIFKIKIDGCGLRTYFKNIIISEEHGVLKPEEGIFRLAEKMTGARREECVMIGDSLESDVNGALNAGWQAVYFAEERPAGYNGPLISSLKELRDIF